MIETMLTVFAVVMVISVSTVVGYLLGERKGRSDTLTGKRRTSWDDPKELLGCVKSQHKSDLFTENREN